jgi:hypothetical protein
MHRRLLRSDDNPGLRKLAARLPGIVELRNGGFRLPSNPNALVVRLRKWFRSAVMALALVAVAAGINFLTRRGPEAHWIERLEVIGMPLVAAHASGS